MPCLYTPSHPLAVVCACDYGYQSDIFIPISVPYNKILNVPAFAPLNLSCVGAYPAEQLIWQFNGSDIVESEHINPETVRSVTLIFTSTLPRHNGLYSCRSRDTGANLSNYNVTFSTGKSTDSTHACNVLCIVCDLLYVYVTIYTITGH